MPPGEGGAAAPEEKKKMIGKYELGELLGEGTFSKVRKAVDPSNGNVVAIKIVNNALVQVNARYLLLRVVDTPPLPSPRCALTLRCRTSRIWNVFAVRSTSSKTSATPTSFSCMSGSFRQPSTLC